MIPSSATFNQSTMAQLMEYDPLVQVVSTWPDTLQVIDECDILAV